MDISEIMTPDPIYCSTDAHMRRVAELMIKNEIGSVVVFKNDYPTGIVTERDLVKSTYKSEEKLSNIPVEYAMSNSTVTIDHHHTIDKAVEMMHERGIKKLVVVEDMSVVGIVTTQDIISNYDALKSYTYEIAEMELEQSD